MHTPIKNYCDNLVLQFDAIPHARKQLLNEIASYIRMKKGKTTNLVFICTHNSRRSHFGQIWAQIASYYYRVSGIKTFSAGTEVTAFNKNAISTLERTGINVLKKTDGANPLFQLAFDNGLPPIVAFSKLIDDPVNPVRDFAAIMTCSQAEENCPFIPGAELRISLPYDDPKLFDNTPLQDQKYDDRCSQIALEMLYLFNLLK